jgi:hypothetical protein
MICLLCPKCRKMLSVGDAHRGGIGQCPGCGQLFRIPAAAPPAALVPPLTGTPTPPPPPPAPSPEPSTSRAVPRIYLDNRPRLPGVSQPHEAPTLPPRPAIFPDFELTERSAAPTPVVKFQPRPQAEEEYETLELDEGDGEEKQGFDVVAEVAPPAPPPPVSAPIVVQQALAVEPIPVAPTEEPLDAIPDTTLGRPAGVADTDDRPRRRRRRRRGYGEGFSLLGFLPTEIIPGVDNFLALLMVYGCLWVLLGALALLAPPLSVFLILLGAVLAIAGNLWFYVIAFQEDFLNGLLCLLVPVWGLLFMLNNLDTAGRPFLIGLVGTLMAVSGVAIAMHMWT